MSQIHVVAFVDWTAQVRNARARKITDPVVRAQLTLKATARAIINALEDAADEKVRFRVKLRLYHGWHRGPAPTKNRHALLNVENDPDFELPRSPRVHIDPPFEYGERLLSALPHRLTKPSNFRFPPIHLPDTYRRPIEDDDEWREKMVDTSIACDILAHARSDPTEWRVIVAEDDDLVPALFSAEAWSKHRGSRNFIIRKRGESKYLVLDGLVKEYRA